MKKIYLFLIFFLSACSSSEIKGDLNNSLNFSEDMDFEEFKIKVIEYANQSTFPNIDK
jgi:hypothetical protein